MINWIRRSPQQEEQHHLHELNCTSLCCASSGAKVCVKTLEGCEIAASKLRDLGVREGARLTVVRDGDPLLVSIDGARFGIGRSAAVNILCEMVETPGAGTLSPRTAPLQHAVSR